MSDTIRKLNVDITRELNVEITRELNVEMHGMCVYDWEEPLMCEIRDACDMLETYFTYADYNALRKDFIHLKENGPVVVDQLIKNYNVKEALCVLAEKNKNRPYVVCMETKLEYLTTTYGVTLKHHSNRDDYKYSWEVLDIKETL